MAELLQQACSMKSTFASNIILTFQLITTSAGLCRAAVAQDPGQVTADQQQSNKTDRELTQKIREAIVDDKSLSMSAHNVKVISRNGTVTLKGKVKSEDEKSNIEGKAVELAGAGKVTNELTVSSK